MPHEHEPDSSERAPREPVTDDGMVAALLREREGYVQRGLRERVAEVDEQLKIRGHEPPSDGAPAKQETAEQHRTDESKPRGRRPPGKSRT
ncbi:hypothetical protein ACQEVF_59515 [Nonomuraea polychroma]|uniref:hypothetical protein n=1 Tax=Nonomuraea polychroma TaxID=46176 RepID=UPI003D8ADB41